MPVTRVMIGTPAAGGHLTNNYVASYKRCTDPLEIRRHMIIRDFSLIERNLQQGLIPPQNQQEAIHRIQTLQNERLFEVGLYTLSQESLLARGRNHIAQRAMTEGWDKLFFIDADSEWTPEHFNKILESPYPITSGTVPLKTYPIVLNYLPFKKDQDRFCGPWNGLKTPESMWAMSEFYGRYVKVAFSGTAFMCIDVKKVLNKLAPQVESYQYPNPATGFNETHWHFFNEAPKEDTFMSEDWGFVSKARERGFDMVIDTEVIIAHRGDHVFRAPQRPTKEQREIWHQEQLKAQHEHYLKLKELYDPTPHP